MTYTFEEDLQRLYNEGRLIPFIGAGVSMSVSWEDNGKSRRGLSWPELVDQASHLLGFDNAELLRVRGTDLQILEYFKLKNEGFARLTNWLFAELRPPDEVLRASCIHFQLARMEKCRVLYTTNYDDFLERSLKLHGREYRRVATESDMGRVGRTDLVAPVEVVKFHGDLNAPDHMVISESHYEERLKLSTAMDYRLRADALGRALLFIGYSFHDWNVAYLFRLMNDQFSQLPGSISGRRAYITVPDPSEFEMQLFQARNIGVIPVSGKNQTRDIAKLLEQIRGSRNG